MWFAGSPLASGAGSLRMVKARFSCDFDYAMRASFGDGERDGVSQHHNQSSVAFDQCAFHEAVLDEVSEVVVYV